MGRFEYITRRLIQGVVVVLAIVVLNFFLIRMAPGDPAAVRAGEAGAGDEQFIAQLREEFRLDEPLPVQLYVYMSGVVQLDLGYSYRQKQNVGTLIMGRLPATLLLMATAFFIAIGLGVLLGTLAATRVGKWTDSVITVVALVFYATPLFWVGLMAILLFSVYLGWLPAFGMTSVGARYTGLAHVLDVAHHLILPAFTLGLFYMAVYARLTRSSMLEVADMDFVRTARAKGLPRARVTRAHILRNALMPVITFAGIQAGQLVGGAILTETVFAWPGIGRLAFDALLQRDYNLLLGIFFISSVMVVAFNLITDLIYTFVDPRIEVGK
ncbi:MAG TPA: ABC transporter permease [Aestuariivirgaceae bacterium]|nr:ABC transporter permease [Aestuariivirgaceae bacterium]